MHSKLRRLECVSPRVHVSWEYELTVCEQTCATQVYTTTLLVCIITRTPSRHEPTACWRYVSVCVHVCVCETGPHLENRSLSHDI